MNVFFFYYIQPSILTAACVRNFCKIYNKTDNNKLILFYSCLRLLISIPRSFNKGEKYEYNLFNAVDTCF